MSHSPLLDDKWKEIFLNLKKECKGHYSGNVLKDEVFSEAQLELWQALHSKRDAIYLRDALFMHVPLQHVYALYAIMHVLKKRAIILKNSERIKEAALSDHAISSASKKASSLLDAEKFRDQGFTRPSVLLLCPMKNRAYHAIQAVIALSQRSQIENKSRFVDEFAPTDDELCPDDSKPDDFNAQFEGKIDDCFRIGIKITKKSLKLYAPFYESDLLVCSPLGLRTLKGSKKHKKQKVSHTVSSTPINDAESDSDEPGELLKDYDFLSSITLVIVDECHVMAMQNWDHLISVFQSLNLRPQEAHDCDFSRIMHEYLDLKGASLRQSIFLSKFSFPDLQGLANTFSSNPHGLLKVDDPNSVPIFETISPIPSLLLYRLDPPSLAASSDFRYDFFVKNSEKLGLNSLDGLCIFVASYFDFVRLKSYLEPQTRTFTCISEYSSGPEISAARSSFYNGHVSILLVTERYHFFKRHTIRGIKHLIFYSLPMEARAFKEYSSFVKYSNAGTSKSSHDNSTANKKHTHKKSQKKDKDSPSRNEHITCLYDKYDMMTMKRIFGPAETARLISPTKSCHRLPHATREFDS